MFKMMSALSSIPSKQKGLNMNYLMKNPELTASLLLMTCVWAILTMGNFTGGVVVAILSIIAGAVSLWRENSLTDRASKLFDVSSLKDSDRLVLMCALSGDWMDAKSAIVSMFMEHDTYMEEFAIRGIMDGLEQSGWLEGKSRKHGHSYRLLPAPKRAVKRWVKSNHYG